MDVNIDRELLLQIRSLLNKELREIDINDYRFSGFKDAVNKIDISIKTKELVNRKPISYCTGGSTFPATEDVATCNKLTLHNAIEQLKEVAKSNGLKAVITFEAL